MTFIFPRFSGECKKSTFWTVYWFHLTLLSLCWFLVREPLPDSSCIKSRYRVGFCMIDSHPVKFLKALYRKGLERTYTFLARWANLATVVCPTTVFPSLSLIFVPISPVPVIVGVVILVILSLLLAPVSLLAANCRMGVAG